MRTRRGPLIKSTKQKDFKYNFILPSHSISSPSISSSLKCDQEIRIRCEQRARAESHSQQICWIVNPRGVDRMAVLHRSSGMSYLLDLSREDWVNAFDGAFFTQVLKRGDQWPRPPQTLELTDPEVKLPRTIAELSGFDQGLHQRLRYGYSDAWKQFITARAQAAVASQPPPHPPTGSTLVNISQSRRSRRPMRPLPFLFARPSPKARAQLLRSTRRQAS